MFFYDQYFYIVNVFSAHFDISRNSVGKNESLFIELASGWLCGCAFAVAKEASCYSKSDNWVL